MMHAVDIASALGAPVEPGRAPGGTGVVHAGVPDFEGLLDQLAAVAAAGDLPRLPESAVQPPVPHSSGSPHAAPAAAAAEPAPVEPLPIEAALQRLPQRGEAPTEARPGPEPPPRVSSQPRDVGPAPTPAATPPAAVAATALAANLDRSSALVAPGPARASGHRPARESVGVRPTEGPAVPGSRVAEEAVRSLPELLREPARSAGREPVAGREAPLSSVRPSDTDLRSVDSRPADSRPADAPLGRAAVSGEASPALAVSVAAHGTSSPEALSSGGGRPEVAIPARVEWLVSRGGGTARMTLHPVELGEVEISVRVRGDAVDVEFRAPEAAARVALLEVREQLGESLEARNLRIESLEVRGGEPRGESSPDGRGEGTAGRDAGVSGEERRRDGEAPARSSDDPQRALAGEPVDAHGPDSASWDEQDASSLTRLDLHI